MPAREIDPNSPVYITYHKVVARHIADGRVHLDTERKRQWYSAYCRTGLAPWPWPRNSTSHALRAAWKAIEAGPIGRKQRHDDERSRHGLKAVKGQRYQAADVTVTRQRFLDNVRINAAPDGIGTAPLREADTSKGHCIPNDTEAMVVATIRYDNEAARKAQVRDILKKEHEERLSLKKDTVNKR